MAVEKLKHEQLRIETDATRLETESTNQDAPASTCSGQDNAVNALKTGLQIPGDGYHVIAIGRKGTGKMDCIYRIAQEFAASKPVTSTPDRVLIPVRGRAGLYKETDLPCMRGQRFVVLCEQVAFAAFNGNNELFNAFSNELEESFANDEVLAGYLQWLQEQCLILLSGENTQYELRMLQSMLPVLLHTGNDAGTPVVREPFPDAATLLGTYSVDNETGQKEIYSGSLIQASGGVLIIDARQFIENVSVWRLFREILNNGLIPLSSINTLQALPSTAHLPLNGFVRLNCKVVLVCDMDVFYQLQALDAHIDTLFPVICEFVSDIPRNKESITTSADMLAMLGGHHDCLPLDRAGLAAMLDLSSRLAGSQHRLSLMKSHLAEYLREASLLASSEGDKRITDKHIKQVIKERDRRLEKDFLDSVHSIVTGETRVELSGRVIGQVNGLTMVTTLMQSYLEPSRITATVRAGDGAVVDIEREVNLGGSIHSKGVLILASLLAGRYSRHTPLSLVASLVFEQSYSEVDGDSASAAEMLALLSAITEVPVKQSLALTGSIDQRGQILCVGDINEKIEGFYRVARSHEKLEHMGVVIPQTNVTDLMLGDDVTTAVKNGQFTIYTVDDIDDVVSLFTDMEAGKETADHEFPTGSFNAKVVESLKQFAEEKRHDQKDDH